MPLSALLEGDFFNKYIKSGQLRLELPKDVYERAGLMGQSIRDVGRKHVKTRYGKCILDDGDGPTAHDLSCRARPPFALNGAWQEGI
ncbi:MAG: hypothetical protein Q9216_005189 [Gyalolechia sp. 2 TL-2023]